jgi:hypothetical protein
MTKATIVKNEICVIHQTKTDIHREYLTVDCPDGWDDVKKLTKKVLEYEGRKYAYTGWNSDRNECYFARSTLCDEPTARILSR